MINPWWLVAYLGSSPEDGIYSFNHTVILDEEAAASSIFELGFRCDNWASGAFRVRKIKIEKGDHASEWSPGY